MSAGHTNENQYNTLPRHRSSHRKKVPPPPPPRRSSIPTDFGTPEAVRVPPQATGATIWEHPTSLNTTPSSECETSSPVDHSPVITDHTHTTTDHTHTPIDHTHSTEDYINSTTDYTADHTHSTTEQTYSIIDHTHSTTDPTHSTTDHTDMSVRRVPSISPTPKVRTRASLSKSKSCDELNTIGCKEEVFTVPRPPVPGRPVKVKPPLIPTESQGDVASSAVPQMAIQHPSSSSYLTFESLSDPLAKSIPLRVEVMEGYMSDRIPHITFSASDMFNIHLLKKQEVVRVKDSCHHTYSIPLHSTVHIGMVQHITAGEGAGGKTATAPRTTKVSDLLNLKDLPKIVCATKAHKSGYGERSSLEEKEVLIILGAMKIPKKKKKALEVFSVNSSAKKTLYPDCAGHFSISPSLTSLPLVPFLKHVKDPFPFKAQLFFKHEDLTMNYGVDCGSVPPLSLTQDEVTVLKRTTETSVIASPFFEDSPVDVACSENLINIPLDRHLGKIEISVVELRDSMERNTLFNNSLTVYQKVDFSKLKYYHDADSELVYYAQTHLYTKCRNKDKIGIKLEQPAWKASPDSNRKSALETYETIPEMYGSRDGLSQDLPDTPPMLIPHANRRRSAQLAEAAMSLSCNVSSSGNPSGRSSRSSDSDSVFTGSLERHTTVPSSPLMGRSPVPHRKQLRPARSHNDVSPRSSMINERPPCPVPKASQRMTHSHSTSVMETPPPTSIYQTPRPHQPAALLSSIATFKKERLNSRAADFRHLKPTRRTHTSTIDSAPPSHMSTYDIPPRNMHRHSPKSSAGSHSQDRGKVEDSSQHHTPSRNIRAPLPPVPASGMGIYQVPRKLHYTTPKSKTGYTGHTPSDRTSSAKSLSLGRTPDNSTIQDGEEVYEEMLPNAISRVGNHMISRHMLHSQGGAGGGAMKEKDQADESFSSGGSTDAPLGTTNSANYGIFQPHVTMSMFEDLKAEVASLTKNYHDLLDQITNLKEEKMKDLKTANESALRKIEELEDCWKRGQGESAMEGETACSASHQEINKKFLKTLSCAQLKTVLEGMNLGQYTAIVEEETLDGEIFMELDEDTLTKELGIASRIHRVKVLKLITGDYDAQTFMDHVTSV